MQEELAVVVDIHLVEVHIPVEVNTSVPVVAIDQTQGQAAQEAVAVADRSPDLEDAMATSYPEDGIAEAAVVDVGMGIAYSAADDRVDVDPLVDARVVG